MKWISQGKTLVLTEAEWVKCPYCKQKNQNQSIFRYSMAQTEVERAQYQELFKRLLRKLTLI